jgi:FAD/FMN-containing dehydrogenase
MDDLDALRDLISLSAIVTDPSEMFPYLNDWRGRYRGRARAVLRPRHVDEVSAIMRWASQTRTPVVPQGGNTGLAGGATPDGSGSAVVLSLGRMNAIRSVDAAGNTLVCEAGCILADVQQAALDQGRQFPVSLASEGSCQIGGIVATNAGGTNVVRYGMTRDLVLGLDYVRADGSIVHGTKKLRKDNAGYDLKQLLIGSEGTLAVITAAALRLVGAPGAMATALCALKTADDALATLHALRDQVGERIESFELMSDSQLDLVLDLVPGIAYPLASRHRWYAFIGISGAPDRVEGDLLAVLGPLILSGTVADAAIAQSQAQAEQIWRMRHATGEANRLAGPMASHDVSVATKDVPAFLAAVEGEVGEHFPAARWVFVGHMGDGNIHVNALFPMIDDPALWDDTRSAVNEAVFALVARMDGSITAEHGVGQSIRAALQATASPPALELMRAVKHAFDPSNILNPGKIFL